MQDKASVGEEKVNKNPETFNVKISLLFKETW